MVFVFVSFLSCQPLPLGAGGVLGIFCHSDCGTGLCDLFTPFRWYNFASPPIAAVVALRWVFAFPSTRFRSAPSVQVIWRWLCLSFFFFCPLRLGLLYFPSNLALLVGFVSPPFRGVGVGFEEPHVRLMFWFLESGLPRIFPYFCICGSSEWASVTVLP